MKKISANRIVAALGIFTIAVLSAFVLCKTVFAMGDGKTVDIMFTSDIHSYLDSYTVETDDGKVQEIGGMARLSTVIQNQKAVNPDTLLIDGGDIAIGTLYQTLYASEAIEFRMLGALGFDATTLGNHDFDYSVDKLCDMFENAAAKSDYLPAFVVSNIDWTADNEDTKNIYESASKAGLAEYIVVDKGDVKIAIFGIFGKEATTDSPTLTLTVMDQIETAKAMVQKIKQNEDVDMIVCISHSGINADVDKSEDEQLAMAVPEIDVILSAHCHLLCPEPIQHGDTWILGAGCYGEYTGLCSLTQKEDGRWIMDKYELIHMDESIPEDPEIKNMVEGYNELVNSEYLAQFGFTMDQVLATSDFSMESVNDMYYVHTDHHLGNFMSDAYRYAVLQTSYGQENHPDIAVVPTGTVRGTFTAGDITVADAFNTYSLGMGFDGEVGYPLVMFYFNGSEVKMIPEIDASLSSLMVTARLYCSGLSYKIGTKRMLLNKAYDIVYNPNLMSEESEQIDDDRLYAVVTDMYTAQMLGSVSRVSKGLIKLTPKYSDGTELESDENGYKWENVVLYNDAGSELKTWCAIADYLQSFEKNDEGISVIPQYYNEYHGRKVIDEKFSLTNFFSQTNKYFWIIVGVVVVALTAVTGVIALFIKILKMIFGKKRVK